MGEEGEEKEEEGAKKGKDGYKNDNIVHEHLDESKHRQIIDELNAGSLAISGRSRSV